MRGTHAQLCASLKCGDLILLSSGWYVTHTGLVRMAKRCRCSGIQVQLVQPIVGSVDISLHLSSHGVQVATAAALSVSVMPILRTFHPGPRRRDARGRNSRRESRFAQGLWDRYLLSRENGWFASGSIIRPRTRETSSAVGEANGNRHSSGTRVRDRLCQIIRRHELDAELVKSYATDFCGAKTFVMLLGNRSRTLSPTSPTGPRRTAMPCSAS